MKSRGSTDESAMEIHSSRTGTQDEFCKMFTEGISDRKEFYSPSWPAPYPNHTDCVLVLEAPKNHILRLDFRDCFDIEPSDDCRFDYLEVRDGAHGYCKLLGLFCGKEFPPMITSTNRFLWLRFHSDENIEYAGFRAVYEYIPKPDSSSESPEIDACRLHVTGSEGTFSSADIPEEHLLLVKKYQLYIDCMWIITVQEGWKISLSFPEFRLEKPNDCDNNFVDVFSDRTDLPSRQRNFCGSIADSVVSRGNVLYVRFYTTIKALKSRFSAMFTAFREKQSGESCTEKEWDCEDTTCIALELRCNGRVNCRFRWDEDNCTPSKSAAFQSEHIIIIMLVFSFILTGMCITFIYHCFRKLMRDYQTIQSIQDHMRISCQQQLTILGHKTEIPPLQSSNSVKELSIEHQLHQPIHDPASPCYVPEVPLIPLPIPQSPHIHRCHLQIQRTFSSSDSDQPEMCDSECQTRLWSGECEIHDESSQASEVGFCFDYGLRFDVDEFSEADSSKTSWSASITNEKCGAPDVIATVAR